MSHSKELKENIFLRKFADRVGLEIQFKDEALLPGTAMLMTDPPLPIDITIVGKKKPKLVINSLGAFGGDTKSFAKEHTRGRGLFQPLYLDLLDLVIEEGYEHRIYLTPLSPVWDRYCLTELKENDAPVKGHHFYLDVDRYLTTFPSSRQHAQPGQESGLATVGKGRYLPWGREG
jgi:hypothetical protein